MKRYIIGGLIGFMLSLGFGAHAEVVSMIGKAIDGSFPIKINGKTLTNQALTIEGVSYVPTREFAESLGAQVKFDANLGIEIVPAPTASAVENPIMKPYRELNDKLNQLVTEKQALEKEIHDIHLKNLLNGEIDGDDVKTLQKQVDEKQTQIDKLVVDKQALEAQMHTKP